VPRSNTQLTDKGIGKRIKAHRQQAKYSQTALGKYLGVSFQQVQKYENGTNRISAASLAKIAKFLNITVSNLMSGDDKPDGRRAQLDAARFAKSASGKALIRDFMAIESPFVRRQVIELVNALSQGTI
jgi:transcriptional regulator with XRE-family HTH domain